jgi:hypothetical protein
MVKLSSQSTLHKIQVLLIRYKYVNNNDCRKPLPVMKITRFMIIVKLNYIVAEQLKKGCLGYSLPNALLRETCSKLIR